MLELAIVVMTIFVAIATALLGFIAGVAWGSKKAAELMFRSLKDADIDQSTAERIVVGIKRPRNSGGS